MDDFGLMFYQARWYDPTIGRFAQADTIIPEQTQGVQAWDRYAYTSNNPVRYNDPSGHKLDDGCRSEGCNVDPIRKAKDAQKVKDLQYRANEKRCRNGNYAYCGRVQGLEIQITLTAGIDTQLENIMGQNVDPLLFYGVSFVFDKHGGFQIFGLTRDIEFNPYTTGPAENAYPMNYGGASITLSAGLIGGTEFAARGTEAYAGRAVDWGAGYGPLSIDHYEAFDENTGKTDLTKVFSNDIGLGPGFIVSGGSFATQAHPWFPRIGPTIQDPWAR